ncbi:MAG: hypothetical protein JSS07_04050 [Proteobacteria bacterium]|nr:hypothetical protein [Pseudomonadota bacterium]
MAILGATQEESQKDILDDKLKELIYRYYSNENLEQNLPEEKLKAILEQINAIREYAKEQFPQDTLLTDEEIIILTLSVRNPKPSPEKNIIATDSSYMEVKRALSRFYCLNQVMLGEAGYDKFAAPQLEKTKKFNPPLKKIQYYLLCDKFQGLDSLTIEILKMATLISSVPLSSEACKRADKILGNKYIVDSVEFPAHMFENIDTARQVYPQVEVLWQKYTDIDSRNKIKELLQSAFSHRRHYRHMLYTEGSESMFSTLLDDFKQKRLSKEAFEFWKMYWKVNIMGFQGHLDPKGSVYLTYNTFKAMNALDLILDSANETEINASYLLSMYLQKRASFLGLDDFKYTKFKLTLAEQKFIAHIGALMRLFYPEQGEFLIASYFVCQDAIKDLFADFFSTDPTRPTPTYAPALFTNVKDFLTERYSKEKIFRQARRIKSEYVHLTADEFQDAIASFETIILCVPLYLSALKKYKQMRNEKVIANNIPLSFQTIAYKQFIEELLENKSIILDMVNVLELVDINVSDTGVVSYDKKTDFAQKLADQLAKQAFLAEPSDTEDQKTYLPSLNLKRTTPTTMSTTALTMTTSIPPIIKTEVRVKPDQ